MDLQRPAIRNSRYRALGSPSGLAQIAGRGALERSNQIRRFADSAMNVADG
jgi:hypothetical protein